MFQHQIIYNNLGNTYGNTYYQQPQIQSKVVTGGIEENVQYNMDTMANFIAWCSYGILKQEYNSSASNISRSISAILYATRLPTSSIIIALEYLNQRFSKHNTYLKNEQIFEFIVIALILANKFNDDNTFTNKSWSGACHLDLLLINQLEREWLEEIKFSLSTTQFESNILVLEECWETYKLRQEETSLNSSPIKYNHSPTNSINNNIEPNYYFTSNTNSNYNYYNSSPIYQQPPYNNNHHYYQLQHHQQQQQQQQLQHHFHHQYHQQQQPIWYDPAIQSIHFNPYYKNYNDYNVAC
ncbi:unnamed protein product [Candida verbasci]|uniref:Cyclin N-terminal domain-containing protein n=1 Tax=Candida verbasci TaxID=1227364 RepID=A0A9W4XEM5_9ASCO|nr:unnamed protein product [Candida verbasci]